MDVIYIMTSQKKLLTIVPILWQSWIAQIWFQNTTLDKLSSWVKCVASLLCFYLLRSIKCCDANLGVQPTLKKDNKFSFLKFWNIPTNLIWTYKCGALTFKLNNFANTDYQIMDEGNWNFPSGIGLSKILEFTTRNHVHSNPCVYNLCPNQSILQL